MAFTSILVKVIQNFQVKHEHKFCLVFGTMGLETIGDKYNCPFSGITAYPSLELALDATNEGSVFSSIMKHITADDASALFSSAGYEVGNSQLTIWVRMPSAPIHSTLTTSDSTHTPVEFTPLATLRGPPATTKKIPRSEESLKPFRLPDYAYIAIRKVVDRVVPRGANGVMLRSPRMKGAEGVAIRPPWVEEFLYEQFLADPCLQGSELRHVMEYAKR